MKRTHSLIVAMSAACVCASTLCYAAGPASIEPSDARPAPAVRLLDIGSSEDVLPGTTRPRRSVRLSSSVDSRVTGLLVREGDAVKAGDVVAVLDDRVAEAALALAKAEASHVGEIAAATARVRRDKHQVERLEKIFANRASNSAELEDARTALALSEADLRSSIERREAAELRAIQAQAAYDEQRVRASFDGVVVRRHVEEGAVVQSGDPIFEVVDASSVSVDLYLPATAALSARPGASYALALDAPIHDVVAAKVRYVEPRLDPTSNTVRVVFDIDQDALPISIRAGVLAKPATALPGRSALGSARR
ncbi:MAG: efflux RND transporter periplasmic adaptor subunit [Planctomycetota bacterium]